MSKVKVYSYLNRPPRKPSPHGGKSLTDASCQADCDINTIIRRYKAGDISVLRQAPSFGDVSSFGDFRSCMEKVRKAQQDFAALPSEIRDRFANDPRLLVDFLRDSKNDDEAIRLGLKVKPKVEKSIEDSVRDGVMAANAAAASAQTEAGRTPTT